MKYEMYLDVATVTFGICEMMKCMPTVLTRCPHPMLKVIGKNGLCEGYDALEPQQRLW